MKRWSPVGAVAAMTVAITTRSVSTHRDERGAGLAEYALLLLLIAVAALGALGTLSGAINAAYGTASGMFN